MGKLKGIAFKKAKRATVETTDHSVISLKDGLPDDHRGQPGNRQITLLAAEDWEKACSDLGNYLPWTMRRANLLTEGIILKESTGRKIQIGEAVLEVTSETEPCYRMDEQYNGLTAALAPDWRGGVCCKVIKGGKIKLDDEIHWVDID